MLHALVIAPAERDPRWDADQRPDLVRRSGIRFAARGRGDDGLSPVVGAVGIRIREDGCEVELEPLQAERLSLWLRKTELQRVPGVLRVDEDQDLVDRRTERPKVKRPHGGVTAGCARLGARVRQVLIGVLGTD